MKLFFKRWKQGIINSTPKQLLEAKLFGQLGQIIGLLIAMVFISINGFTYFLVFLAFTVFILVTELLRTYKEYEVLKKW